MARVNKDEKHDHLFREVDIIADYLFELLFAGSRHLCVSVTWKVHEIPLSVDEEVIYQSGFTWLAGCHRKFFVVTQHVDKRRLTDVGSTDKSELRELLFRLFGNPRATTRK